MFVVFTPRQRIVTPFAGNRVRAAGKMPIEDETTADTGAEDNPKYTGGIGAGAVAGFGERETIGVVCQFNRTLQG